MRFPGIDPAVTLVCAALAFGCSSQATTTITPPNGCNTNATLICDLGDGWTCTLGTNPQALEPGLSCSVPETNATNSADVDYCCIAWTSTSTTCVPDDTFAQCSYPLLGYQCDMNENPTTLDPSLDCVTSSTDPDGIHEDFCCK